ncbi:MAG: translation initiation factor IF-2 N-terminal domain-containing protein, partial [Chitinispirillales bacterium]|nr:translation initiation factor IF-2 N-terminal domain-containing protein [Chitinispirillales bacterium]
MAKKKVFELAEEFKMSSTALMQMLRGMGISVKSHMSTVDEELRVQIKEKFEQERAEIKKQYERKKKLLEKERQEFEEAAAAPPTSSAAAATDAPATTAPKKSTRSSGIKAQIISLPSQPQPRPGQQAARTPGQKSQQQQRPKGTLRKYHQKEAWAKSGFTGGEQAGGQAGHPKQSGQPKSSGQAKQSK